MISKDKTNARKLPSFYSRSTRVPTGDNRPSQTIHIHPAHGHCHRQLRLGPRLRRSLLPLAQHRGSPESHHSTHHNRAGKRRITERVKARQTQRSDSNLSEGKFTYRGAVEYDLAKENLLFGSYETGFRSGGFELFLAIQNICNRRVSPVILSVIRRHSPFY